MDLLSCVKKHVKIHDFSVGTEREFTILMSALKGLRDKGALKGSRNGMNISQHSPTPERLFKLNVKNQREDFNTIASC